MAIILTHGYSLRVNHIKHYLQKSYPKFTKPKSEDWVASSNLLVAKYLKNNRIKLTFYEILPKNPKI
jgi:hypothetical protein